jgi:ribosomal protein L37E
MNTMNVKYTKEDNIDLASLGFASLEELNAWHAAGSPHYLCSNPQCGRLGFWPAKVCLHCGFPLLETPIGVTAIMDALREPADTAAMIAKLNFTSDAELNAWKEAGCPVVVCSNSNCGRQGSWPSTTCLHCGFPLIESPKE